MLTIFRSTAESLDDKPAFGFLRTSDETGASLNLKFFVFAHQQSYLIQSVMVR